MQHEKDLTEDAPRRAYVHVREEDEEGKFCKLWYESIKNLFEEAKNAEVVVVINKSDIMYHKTKERAEWEGFEEVSYQKCCWAGWGRGEVAIFSNLPGMTHVRAECHHIHEDESGDKGNDQVTAHEVFAVILGIEKAKGKKCVRIMPHTVGDRRAWGVIPRKCLQEEAMRQLLSRWCATGSSSMSRRVWTAEWKGTKLREGMTTPKEEQVAKLKIWKDVHIYIGRRCDKMGLGESFWQNPFKVHMRGQTQKKAGRMTEEEAVRRYEVMVRGSKAMMEKIQSLSGMTLVCHCKVGRVCHRQVLIKIFNEKFADVFEDGVVYAGASHRDERRTRTEFSSEFEIGADGGFEECMIKYKDQLWKDAEKLESVKKLKGKKIMCECMPGRECHVDVLAWAANCRGCKATKAVELKAARRPCTIAGILIDEGIIKKMEEYEKQSMGMLQNGIDGAVRSLFPKEMTEGMKIPVLSDLYVEPPFTLYRESVKNKGLDCRGPLPPLITADLTKGARGAAEGSQKGGFFSNEALAQEVALGLEPERHFEEAVKRAIEKPFPMDRFMTVDDDVEMVAEQIERAGIKLERQREGWFEKIEELASRAEGITRHLRSKQDAQVAKVAGQMHVGMLAVAVIFMAWPDTKLPWRYMVGFETLGKLEVTQVLRASEGEKALSEEELLKSAEATVDEIEKKVEKDPEVFGFLLNECRKDEERGVGSPLHTREEMDSWLGKGQWLPMPRFLHVQPSGKFRPIDDGSRYDHNLATQYSETLDCVTAIQPALHIKVLAKKVKARVPARCRGSWKSAMRAKGMPKVGIATGTEDLPDAYRYVPTHPRENKVNIVAVYDGSRQKWLYQVVYGHVFGKKRRSSKFP